MAKKPAKKKFTTMDVRRFLNKLTNEQILMTARGAVEELVSRNHMKCIPALKVLEMLAPENFDEAGK